MTSDGRRQILSFQFPGDISDLYSFVMKVMDHNVGTLTNCRIGLIPHRLLQKITEENPHLTRLFWRDTLIDSSSFREWMVGIGRRPARARVAHLLCEILLRFRAIGQGEDHRFNLPLTQSDLADCLGMSLVHINRILQALRQESLIEFGGGTVAITDWERLRELAGFDDAYLHFSNSALA
jgi:CRP-like cAMP-binding protein